MSKYQNGKIYKITNEDMPELVYYGSTICNLNKRLANHKYDIKRSNNTSKILFNTENYKIDLVELYPCKNRKQLCEREGWYIRNNNCINKNISGRNVKEYHKDYQKEYYNLHKECKKKYYKECNKKYYNLNKNKINKNKNEKIKCKCGKIISKQNLATHKKTKKHLAYSSSS
jgi:hypothetical protein